jgi:hypothetical protein
MMPQKRSCTKVWATRWADYFALPCEAPAGTVGPPPPALILTLGSLAKLSTEFGVDDFDVSPDGSEILFNCVQETSELALIDRAQSSANP